MPCSISERTLQTSWRNATSRCSMCHLRGHGVKHSNRRQRRASALQADERRRVWLQQRWLAHERRIRAAGDAQAHVRGRLVTLQRALALEESCIKGCASRASVEATVPSRQTSLSRTSTGSAVWHLPRNLSGGTVSDRPPAGARRVALALVQHEMDREAARQELWRQGGRGAGAFVHFVPARKQAFASILALFSSDTSFFQ